LNNTELLEQLRLEALEIHAECSDCGKSLVFGEGPSDASMMLVGEAPGGEEDRQGRLFVGPAGRTLDAELALAGIARDSVYITSVVKRRPLRVTAGRVGNRPPTPAEVAIWTPILMRQIAIVRPRLILCLGTVAANALIHPGFVMKRERGAWFMGPGDSRVLATYHPAYIRRFARPGRTQLAEFRQDLVSFLHASEKNS